MLKLKKIDVDIVKWLLLILLFSWNQLLISSSNRVFYSSDKSVCVKQIGDSTLPNLKVSISGIQFSVNNGIKVNDKFFSFTKAKLQSQKEENNIKYYTLEVRNSPFLLEIALLDKAFAFRYKSKTGKQFHVQSEQSTFVLSQNHEVYYFERTNSYKLKSYAGTWEHCSLTNFPTNTHDNPIQGAPLLFHYPDGKMAILTEVNLSNYSGARWDSSISGQFSVNFTENEKGFFVNSPLCSPWRVLFVTDNLTELVNQKVIKQLAEKPDAQLYKNTDYIIPGKCVWRWFSKGTGSPLEEKEFIDYAAKLNFNYSMIDEGWEKWNNYWIEMKELSAYGKSKNVEIFVWKRSSTIANPANNYEQMRNWLDTVKYAGVAGIKVDFMDSESKDWIDFDIKLLQESAKRRLLVNFHGCQKPTGEQYTFPNEITREGIRGLELNKHPEGPIPAYHNVLLPFTRFVLGHGDYTPLSFVNPGNTTFAHQLATLVVFDSPLQVIAEDPEIILNNPIVSPAVDFIKAVPTVWDETIVLPQTQVGKTAVVARRSNHDWFIYALNATADTITLSMDFSKFISVKKSKTILFVDNLNTSKIRIFGEDHRESPLLQQKVIPFRKIEKPFYFFEEIIIAPYGGSVLWIQ